MLVLIAALALQWWHPSPIFRATLPPHVLGWSLLIAGILLAGWAVISAGEVDTSRPTRIVDTGAYARGRNPMYVAWTLIYLAVAVLANSVWLLVLLPALLLYTHFFVVLREERQLEHRLGEEYLRYRARVRRYL